MLYLYALNVSLLYVESNRNLIMKKIDYSWPFVYIFSNDEYLFLFCDFWFFPFIFVLWLTSTLRQHFWMSSFRVNYKVEKGQVLPLHQRGMKGENMT